MWKVDTREPQYVKELAKTKLGSPIYEALSVGDYESENVIVERKHITDLFQSIYGQRIEEQLSAMSLKCLAEDKVGILWIVGTVEELTSALEQVHIKPNLEILSGMVASAVVRYGLQIVWTCTEEQGMEILCKIDKKISDKKLGVVKVGTWKAHSNRRVAKLAMLLEVPWNVAFRLIDRFKTIRGVLLAKDSEIATIYGIGPATMNKIREVLDK